LARFAAWASKPSFERIMVKPAGVAMTVGMARKAANTREIDSFIASGVEGLRRVVMMGCNIGNRVWV